MRRTNPMAEMAAGLPNSAETQDSYKKAMGWFFEQAKTTPEAFASMKGPAAGLVKGYIAYLVRRVQAGELAPGTVRTRIAPIRKFCRMNKMKIDWEGLAERLPEGNSHADDRSPTREEIRTLLAHAPLRMKAAALLMGGSGLRVGCLVALNVGDVSEIEGCGRVVAYRGQGKAEYITFATPEAMRAVADYLASRRAQGEDLQPSSPLIRNVFDGRGARSKDVKRARVETLGQDFGRLWVRAGVRGTKEGRRFAFKGCHSFRKWFKTQAETSGALPLAVETLLGHATGLSGSYYRPTEAALLAEFHKAVPALSIGGEERQAAEIEALEAKHEDGLSKVELELLKEREARRDLEETIKQMKTNIVEDLKAQLKAEGYTSVRVDDAEPKGIIALTGADAEELRKLHPEYPPGFVKAAKSK
jgi:integrase